MTTREADLPSSAPPPSPPPAATSSSPHSSSRNISPRTSPGLPPKASPTTGNTNTDTTRHPSVHFPPTATSPPLFHSPPSSHRADSNNNRNNNNNRSDNATAASAAPVGAGAESSGDEITPIMQRERGSGRGRSYDGTATTTTTMKSSSSNGGSRRRGKRGSKGAVKSTERRDGDDDDDDDDDNDELRDEEDGEEEDKDTEGWSGASKAMRWIKSVAEKYGSVELDNKGSVARDHLALERTFLAWLRTSLAFASIGIAITQLFRLNTTISERQGLTPDNPDLNTWHLKQVGKPLGATFLGIAILVLLLGGRRYFESQYWIIRGKFPVSRGSVLLVTGVAVGLIVTSLVVVCVVDPSVFEKR